MNVISSYYDTYIDSEDIELSIYKYDGDKEKLWNIFKHCHYLSADINKACTIFVCYWGDILVGMFAVLPLPSSSVKYGFRGHRLVVLEDYQSLGIGTKLLDFVGDYYLKQGLKFYARTSHLRLRQYFSHHNTYITTSKNDKARFDSDEVKRQDRVCGSVEYVGKDYATKPHVDIYVDWNDNINIDTFTKDMLYLKEKGYYITVISGMHKFESPIEKACLQLGIRTQLLYYLGKISKKYEKEKIITVWDDALSQNIRDYFK